MFSGIKHPFAAAGGLANKNIAAQCNFVSIPFSYASVQNGEGLQIPSLPRAALQTKTLLRNEFCFQSFFVRKRPEWRGIADPFAAAGGLARKKPLLCKALFVRFQPFAGKQSTAFSKQKKRRHLCRLFSCGERGIRTPGGVTLNGFQDRRIRPLCHLSNEGAKITFFSLSATKPFYRPIILLFIKLLY